MCSILIRTLTNKRNLMILIIKILVILVILVFLYFCQKSLVQAFAFYLAVKMVLPTTTRIGGISIYENIISLNYLLIELDKIYGSIYVKDLYKYAKHIFDNK